jgi:zinc protease
LKPARLLRAALASAALLLAAAPLAAAPRPAAAPARTAVHAGWPQAHSDVTADPSIRFGTLPNGLRYAIRKQSIPPQKAALRLWMDAGSLMESDAQQGLAHFLEHMAFNGSKGVKEGEMVRILERLGLAFGADTNASTDFDQTIYKLDLPKTDAETVDTSLMLLREAASNLTIDAAAVDRERGVVLSEERASDTPSYRVLVQQLSFLFPGQRLPTRLPIGKVQVLKEAPASEIAAFYRRWYRPDRAVLVAVGDFDVDAMEAKIRARFGDWRAAGAQPVEPPQGPVAPRKAAAKLVVEPGVRQTMQIAWVDAPDSRPDSLAKRRSELIENLGLAVLNRRYSRISRAAEPPFLSAYAYEQDQRGLARVATVAITAERGRWREALAAAEREQRRAVLFGVRQDELDREVEELRQSLKAAVAGSATRRQAELAGDIVNSLDDDEVVTAPEQDLATFESTANGLKAETVSAALKGLFHGQGPLVFMASPEAIPGGEATVLAAFEGSRQAAVTPPAAAAAATWPYESFGTPGKVAETRTVQDLGVTFLRFENGVRVTVKPTKFRDDEVLVRVNVGHGMVDLPSDKQSPYWAANAFVEGGLKKIEVEDMERVLASRLYGARLSVTDDAFVLSGGTRPADLPTQMQVLAAYLTEPAWREAAFQRLKGAAKTIHDQYDATDQGVLARDLEALLHSGDRRWTFPSRDEIANANLADVRDPIMRGLSQGSIEVVIVGDVTVEQARDAVAATFGALPPRPDPSLPPADARRVAFPGGAPTPVVRTHKGRGDQAIGYLAWGTTDYWANPQRARNAAIMREIMQLRITDQLRESQGATYSPRVGSQHSLVWTGWGYVYANVEVPPDKLDGFFRDTLKIAEDLRGQDVSADELARAKKPRLEGLQRAQLTNNYWLGELSGASADPRRLDVIREMIPGTERVTAADVRRAAQELLVPEKAWRLEVLPATRAQAATTAPGS